jgi:exodeoxyribonuclease-5
MALDVDLGPLDVKPSVDARRDAEAETVAEMCARLIGSFELFDHKTGVKRPCRPGDIALLAPTGTSLWRYEAALEERGVPVSTQAGKGFFRRQEVQDLIAVTRVLADGRDTLALGALLRGPLIGLSEEQLLDIVWSLPRPGDSPESLPPLNLAMPTEAIQDTYAREMVEKLQALRKLGNSTTPHALLSQAVDLLRVRSMLVRRHRGQAERALANLDLYLSLCRAYSTRGLRAFAEAMAEAWSAARDEGGKTIEGRADVQEEAVALYTMHASKGLEWPIVVPINTMGRPMTGGQAVVDRAEGCIYAQILGVEPDGYEAARAAEDAEIARERVRLWYVATTRARELLVLPRPSVPAAANAWSNLVDLALDALPSLDLTNLPETFEGAAGAAVNSQDRVAFAAEAAAIAAAQRKLVWRAPSRDEGPRETAVGGPAILLPRENEEAPVGELEKSVQGGRERGLVIHKLFEEVLNGETDDDLARLTARAAQLITELGRTAARDPAAGLVAAEMAGCVVRSLAVPDIAVLLPSLAAELPVYSSVSDGEAETATAGVVDAASVDQDGKLVAVVDWKSDVAPDSGVIDRYREQVLSYLDATGAAFGLIVFVTTGIVVKVAAPRQGTL